MYGNTNTEENIDKLSFIFTSPITFKYSTKMITKDIRTLSSRSNILGGVKRLLWYFVHFIFLDDKWIDRIAMFRERM